VRPFIDMSDRINGNTKPNTANIRKAGIKVSKCIKSSLKFEPPHFSHANDHMQDLNQLLVCGMSNSPQPSWQCIEQPHEGQCVRFEYAYTHQLQNNSYPVKEEGFASCFQGNIRVWKNHCPHAGSPLDWIPGQFFSEDGQHIICHTHHAVIDPELGDCLAGPCSRGLYPLPFQINNDHTMLVPAALDDAQVLTRED